MTLRTKSVAAPMRIGARCGASRPPGRRTARADPRWPQIAVALADLRERGRYAIRIVDADCACGTLLIAAACHAHALGFTGIEARGIDNAPALIGRARVAAGRVQVPPIGFSFDLADMVCALIEEADFPADLVLWHDGPADGHGAGVQEVLAAAGDVIIGDSKRGAFVAVTA